MLTVDASRRLPAGSQHHAGLLPVLAGHRIAYPEHRHRDLFEIVIVLAGRVEQRLGDVVVIQGPGDCALIRDGDSHHLRGTDCSWLNLAVSASLWRAVDTFLDGALRPLETAAAPPTIRLTTPQADLLADRLQQIGTDQAAGRRALLLAIDPFLHDGAAAPTRPAWLTRGLARAASMPIDRLSPALLVGCCGCSREHLARTMRQHVGCSPSTWCTERRLDALAARLQIDDAPVTECILDCGFNSLNYAYQLFRRRYGCAPRSFRARRHGSW